MMREKLFIGKLTLLLFLGFAGCTTKPTVAPWTAEQKTTWLVNTKTFLTNSGVGDKDAADFANCMLEKTSAEYTFDQATNLTEEQASKLWKKCDYSW